MVSSKFSRESVSGAIACAMSAVGVEELKKEQDLAIRSFVDGRDVFQCGSPDGTVQRNSNK